MYVYVNLCPSDPTWDAIWQLEAPHVLEIVPDM